MFQYLILSAFGLFSLSSNFIPDQLQVTPGFKFRYYTNNTMGRYANIGTKEDHRFKAYLNVYSNFKFFDVIKFNIGMQGWSTDKTGFINGAGGGVWGFEIFFTSCGKEKLCIKGKAEHYSSHTFDNANLGGSYDYIGLTFEYNSMNETKGLLGWL